MTLLAGVGRGAGPAVGPGRRGDRHATANRGRREIEGLIGFFVNTLRAAGGPVRLAHRGGAAGAGGGAGAGGAANQDIPFEQVVERLQPVRSLAHTPLFQVMFAWQNAPGATALGLALAAGGTLSRAL